jgi:hypothetical protein
MKTTILALVLLVGCGRTPCPEHTTEQKDGSCQFDPCFDFGPDGGVDPDPFYVCGVGGASDGSWGCRCTR